MSLQSATVNFTFSDNQTLLGVTFILLVIVHCINTAVSANFYNQNLLLPHPQAVIALIMVIPSDIGSLIDFFSFTAWIFYGMAMVALLVLRRTRPDAYRPYKVFIGVPILVLLISIFLVVAPIIEQPQIEYLYASLFILAGLIFYYPFVYLQKVLPGMGGCLEVLIVAHLH